ncbi:MAG: hypothetical protein JJT82_00525 [Legionellaceae bacterium]|nr:hypothetical protein [Legionellaceae bacterium]
MKKIFLLPAAAVLIAASSAYAAMAGLCDDAWHTQYICCPHTGWNVGNACWDNDEHRSASHCMKDTDRVDSSGLPILEDCKYKGGSRVYYPF